MTDDTLFNQDGAGTTSLREMEDGHELVEMPLAVRECDIATKKNGEPFLKMTLADASGSVAAISWSRAEELAERAKAGPVVIVSGKFGIHPQFGRQIKVEDLRQAEQGEWSPEGLSAGPPVAIDQMEADLRELIGTIQRPDLRELLDRFFGTETDAWARFREAPAAKYYHQAYPGGLLEHSLSVAQSVSAASAFFPGIDRDVAVTGALLHDIGKTEAYNDDPIAIDLTDDGKLLGEIPIGYYLVRREIEAVSGFDEAVAKALCHIILSHHGKLEHGSPVVPSTREAALVHAMDKLGGTLGSFDRLERELADGESWSRFDRGLETSAFFGDPPAA